MKKSEFKTMIRKIVREEVAMAIHEVITEIKQPVNTITKETETPKQKPKKKIIKEKQYTKNSVLNGVLNETANSDWKTLGDGTYTTDRMNEVVGSSYADMMNGDGKNINPDMMVASLGGDPNTVDDSIKNALTRDYSDLMKAIDKKQGK